MFGDLFLNYHLEYISCMESSVNKQIHLNYELFLHREIAKQNKNAFQ